MRYRIKNVITYYGVNLKMKYLIKSMDVEQMERGSLRMFKRFYGQKLIRFCYNVDTWPYMADVTEAATIARRVDFPVIIDVKERIIYIYDSKDGLNIWAK